MKKSQTEMSGDPDLAILIPAAGLGERLALGPKALLELAGKPLLTWVTRKALQLSDDVIVAAPPGYLDQFQELCPGCHCIEGGSTRQQSVANLLDTSTREWVIIADVARPFASSELFHTVLAKARQTGAAGAFLKPDVPVALLDHDQVVQDFQRSEVGIFQAPQAFARKLLSDVHAEANQHNWQEQSTLQLVLRAGKSVGAVPGEKTNIKLTTPEDWQLAQLFTEYLS